MNEPRGVRTDRDRDVLIVTIDRPHVRNAIDPATADELLAAFRAFDGDDGLRVAVLTGAGGTFCSGADLKALAAGAWPPLEDVSDGTRSPLGPPGMTLSKPVIAAVEGHAVAGGLELALWCDLRVASSDAAFGVLNRRFGVPLVDLGTIRLPRIVGQGHALDLILTGRTVDAEEASRMGLLDRVVEPGRALEAAVVLAHEIASFPQATLRHDRASVLEQWSLSFEEAAANERRHGAASLGSGEAAEGAASFVERAPSRALRSSGRYGDGHTAGGS